MAEKLEFMVDLAWWTKGVALGKSLHYSVTADNIWEVVQNVSARHKRPESHTHYINIRQVFDYEKEDRDRGEE